MLPLPLLLLLATVELSSIGRPKELGEAQTSRSLSASTAAAEFIDIELDSRVELGNEKLEEKS